MCFVTQIVMVSTVFAGVDQSISGRTKASLLLQKEAYYHYFQGDYLTAATRLLLLEDSEAALLNPEVLNESQGVLGSLYLSWDMDEAAEEIFEVLLERSRPGKTRNKLLLTMQKIAYKRHFFPDAIHRHELISEQEAFSDMDQVSYIAGMSHIASGTLNRGIKVLSEVNPESQYAPFARMSIAKTHFAMNEIDQSLVLLQSLSQDLTNQAENTSPATDSLTTRERVRSIFFDLTHLTLGQLSIESGRLKTGRTALSKISSQSPFYPDALFSIAWSHLKEKNELRAILFFQDLITKAPKHIYALEALADIAYAYKRLEAYGKAIDHYEVALAQYHNKQKKLKLLLEEIESQNALVHMLNLYRETGGGALSDWVDHEGIASWITRYRELEVLDLFFDQKIRDMTVFDVAVNHREAVFQNFMPSLTRVLKSDRISDIRRRGGRLQAQFEKAVEEETLVTLTNAEEQRRLIELSELVERSRTLGLKIRRIKKEAGIDSNSRSALWQSWEKTDRNLNLAHGLLTWTMITEIPGRADDLGRQLKNLMSDLQGMSEQNRRLAKAAPTMSQKIRQFRKEITKARSALISDKKEGLTLQKDILTALQQGLTEHITRRLDKLDDWIATNELNRIQILEIQTGAQVQ